MIFEHDNFRSFLKATLSDQIQRNPSFSLRAMARWLGVSHSQLSECLSGKVSFSPKTARKIALTLGLSPPETEYFCLLVQIDAEKDLELRASYLERLTELHPAKREVQDLSVDLFKKISEWYHCAIIELARLPDSTLTAEVAARKLGISMLEAEVAIERLERLGILEKTPAGPYHCIVPDLKFISPAISGAMNAFHRKMMEKVSSALDTQAPGKERLSGFETVPLAKDALPEINDALERFFEEVYRIASRYPKPTEIYHLGIHFINLTPTPSAKTPSKTPSEKK